MRRHKYEEIRDVTDGWHIKRTYDGLLGEKVRTFFKMKGDLEGWHENHTHQRPGPELQIDLDDAVEQLAFRRKEQLIWENRELAEKYRGERQEEREGGKFSDITYRQWLIGQAIRQPGTTGDIAVRRADEVLTRLKHEEDHGK